MQDYIKHKHPKEGDVVTVGRCALEMGLKPTLTEKHKLALLQLVIANSTANCRQSSITAAYI